MKKTEFNRSAVILSTAILIIGAVCLISIIVLCINGVRNDIWDKNVSENNGDAQQKHSCRLQRTPDYGQNYVDRLIFVGDSSIYHIAGSGVLAESTAYLQVWTGRDNSLPLDNSIDIADIIYPETNEGMTVAEAAKIKKPEFIIITLGIENGVAYCGEEKFISYYSKLIDSLQAASPTTKIILQSIFPVSVAYEKNNPSVTNKKIDRANGWIEAFAEEKELRYLDTASILKNQKGYLNEGYDRGDGLRLNSDGYFTVINYIRTHGYK